MTSILLYLYTMNKNGIFTFGHSNRTIDQFVSLLITHQITVIIDVRANTHSQSFPQFSKDNLRDTMEQHGIKYHWAGHQLGGQRIERPKSKHTALTNGMQAYADHMETDLFQKSAMQIVNLSMNARIVLISTQTLPEDNHRWLISDYLTLKGYPIKHIINEQEPELHSLSSEARRESAALIYDRDISN